MGLFTNRNVKKPLSPRNQYLGYKTSGKRGVMMLGLGHVMVFKGHCSELYRLLRPMLPFVELQKKNGQEQN